MSTENMTIRTADERGAVDLGWLQSRHTFSFGQYHDPSHMGFRSLRVINDDVIQPGQGFPTHPHRDMEILSVVAEGALEHRDNLGNGSVIRPGEVQRMTAGTGIQHSEFNPLSAQPTRLLQIWIEPEARGLTPGYEQKTIAFDEAPNQWVLLASRDGANGAVLIHQDVRVLRSLIKVDRSAEYSPAPNRYLWLQVIFGQVELGGKRLAEGDGAALTGAATVDVAGIAESSDVLLFDLS